MEYFIAEVRDLKDPWESGRVKIRVYGHQDDEQNVKDEDLPWAMPMQPITSAATNRIGTSPTGMLVGSRVMGFWLDDSHQYPVIMGTFARAGKQKDEKDNTKGKDDIDEQYSDVPLAAIGSPGATKSTAFKNPLAQSSDKKKRPVQAKNGYEKNPKYNKNKPSEKKGDEALSKSRDTYAKTKDKGTVSSLGKDQNGSILEKILKVDNKNDAGAMPMVPQMFQQILQVGNMTSMSGIQNMLGGSLGGALGGIAGNLGINNVLGSLSGALGLDLTQLSGLTGMLGNFGSGGGGGGSGGDGGTFFIPYNPQGGNVPVPTNPKDVAFIAAVLLNMLGGHITSTKEINSMSADDKEAMYKALLELMDKVGADLKCNTYITIRRDTIDLTNPNISNTDIEQIYSTPSNGPIIYRVILPGLWKDDIKLIPTGSVPVFYFTDTDPYPGYMEWEGDNGERYFCPRPTNRPYTATPSEDVINQCILNIIMDLINLILTGQLTLEAQINLISNARQNVTDLGNENTHGKGSSGNMMGAIQGILGVLQGLLGNMMSKQLPQSVLQQSKVQKTMDDYKKKNADLRKKKQLAKQAVQQKNQSQNLMNSGLLNFGNMGGGGSGGGNNNNAGGGGTAPGNNNSNTAVWILKQGGKIISKTQVPRDITSNTTNYGFYSTL